MANLDVQDRPLLLSRRDAARALAISERKLWELTALGRIRHVRIDRCVRYEPAALREFVSSQEGRAT